MAYDNWRVFGYCLFIPQLKKGAEKGEAHPFTFLEPQKVSLTISPFSFFFNPPLIYGSL
jgi:hypothetical protein